MANTPTRPIRVDLNLWARFGAAADDVGEDRSTLIRQFMEWYARDPGARLPRRRPLLQSEDSDQGGEVSRSAP
jgi:hypothetical protein